MVQKGHDLDLDERVTDLHHYVTLALSTMSSWL